MRRSRWLLLASSLFCILAVPRVKAAVGFQPPSPDELKITSEPLAPGAPAIILYRQVDRDDNPHTGHEDNYIRIKILTEEGRKYGDIEIEFVKGLHEVNNVHARTIRPAGRLFQLQRRFQVLYRPPPKNGLRENCAFFVNSSRLRIQLELNSMSS